jgi:hypothetical protein
MPDVRMGFLVVLAAVLVGCGGSDSTISTTQGGSATGTTQGGQGRDRAHEGEAHQGGGGETAPTKAHFITEADAVCSHSEDQVDSLLREIQALGTPTPNSEKARHAAALFRRLADTLAQQTAQLRQLRPPPGDEATINNWLSTAEGASSVLRDLADAYDSANAQRIRLLGGEFLTQSSKASAIAQGYGFKVCGSARQ